MPLPHQRHAAEAIRFDDPLVDRVIDGRYHIVEPLGAGGMGQVYRALQLGLEREVALKVLPAGMAGSDLGFVKRFCLEASITARLGHPNTVTIFDYGRTDDGIFYIAMEYLEGRTLAQLLEEEGALAAPRLLRIATQIARAAREAHRNGLVHRDLKPSNVMLVQREDDAEFVKVLDFGLARFFGSGADADLTQSGTFVGSPQYMAPELARSEPATPRSDVYSLGVMLYEMACGRPPFASESSIAVLLEHASAQPTRPRMLARELPAAVEHVILRAMRKEPGARYGSMDELLEALLWAETAIGVGPGDGMRPLLSSSDVEAIEVGSRRRYWRRKLTPWVAGLLAAAGAAAALAHFA